MRRRMSLLLVVAVLCMVAGPALGAITSHYAPAYVNEGVSFNYGELGACGNQGGPFIGTLASGIQWRTYCVEADGGDETFGPNNPYFVESIYENSCVASKNYVSDAAKWLYYEAPRGGLAGWSLTQPTEEELQEAIWHDTWRVATSAEISNNNVVKRQYLSERYGLQTYVRLFTGGGDPADATALQWANLADNSCPYVPGLGDTDFAGDDVIVINPQDASGPAQSMLGEVPEPATIIVWSLLGAASWLGMGVWRGGRRSWSAENRRTIEQMIETKLHS